MRSGAAGRLISALMLVLGLLSTCGAEATAQPAKKAPAKLTAPPAPPEALLKSDLWKDVPATPLQPGEIDQLLNNRCSLRGSGRAGIRAMAVRADQEQS
jgi:hypothetical protein